MGVKNSHFPNKRPVGERLAGLALGNCYGQAGLLNSPAYKSFTIEGGKVRLKFADADGLHTRSGGVLKGFAIRGKAGDWMWATGRIEGNDIVVGAIRFLRRLPFGMHGR